MAKTKRVRKGTLMELTNPTFVSLVGQPANRAGFKVFRSDDESTAGVKFKEQLETVIQRKEGNTDFSVHSIMLPSDIVDRAEAELVQATFGLTDGYTLVERDGRFILEVDGTERLDEVVVVELGDGFEAEIVRSDKEDSMDTKDGLRLLALRFDADKFLVPESISRWLKENEIDCKFSPIDIDGYIVVETVDEALSEIITRAESVTGMVPAGDGVEAIVEPYETMEIPGSLRLVRNYAYGNWGWGATDFNVAVADRGFSSWLEESIYALRNVLEEVAFYNDPAERTPEKLSENIARVCLQFASSVANMAATLPRSVENSDAAEGTTGKESEETIMPDPNEKTDENAVLRDNENSTGTVAPAADSAVGEAPAAEASVEGGDTATIESTEGGEQQAATSDSVDPNAEVTGKLSNAISALAEAVNALREDNKTFRTEMAEVKQSVQELGDSVVVRNDGDDPIPAKRSSDDNGGDKSVFKGAIFRS